MEATIDQINALFPYPINANALGPGDTQVPSPVRQAGWTDASSKALLELLKDNHKRWHVFFNDRLFHNHASHHLVSLYAMGADEQLLKAAYETHCTGYLKPAFPPPEDKRIDRIVDESNWKDHLGDQRYYQAYVAFFSSKLEEGTRRIRDVLEDYVFSQNANIVPDKTGKPPMMLSRFLAGVLHPLIHAGYGVEFGLPGLMSEGISQSTGKPTEALSIYPASLWDSSVTANMTSQLASFVNVPSVTRVHALTVLARISKDPAFESNTLGLKERLPELGAENNYDRVARIAGKRLLAYTAEWCKDFETGTITPSLLSEKFEELAWTNTVIYAVGGWAVRKRYQDEKGAFSADFFLMHLVTSVVLLPAYLNAISSSSASLLLRTFFNLSLIIYIARGRSALPIADFYANTTARPAPPSLQVGPAKDTLSPAAVPNPWLPILQTTLVHPNEHLCKLQRALSHFAQVYGGRAKGHFSQAGIDVESPTGLQGLQELDGTLFIRAAGLSADRLGWMREGEEQRSWDGVLEGGILNRIHI